MSQQYRVKSIARVEPRKPGGKPFWELFDASGAKVTSFDAAIAAVTPGALLEVELQVKGQYTNITSWKIVETAPSPVPPAAPGVHTFHPPDADEFMRQQERRQALEGAKFALGEIGACIRTLDVNVADAVREKYWASLGRLIAEWEFFGQAAPGPAAPAEEPLPFEPSPAPVKNPYEPPFANTGAMLTAALRLKPPVQPHELARRLGLKSSTEITDTDAAWAAAKQMSEERRQ